MINEKLNEQEQLMDKIFEVLEQIIIAEITNKEDKEDAA